MKEYTVTVDDYGTKMWYLNGELHREDGPAVEYADGDKFWFLHGERHREDGPAIEFPNGNKYWCLNGEPVTEQEHKRRTSRVTMDDALEAGDGVILSWIEWEQAERIAGLESQRDELLEALELALISHNRLLLSDPPKDAWVFNGVEAKARAAIAKAKGE